MTFSFFVPCLVACRILASDQGSNLVSSESAQVLTTGLPGNSQMILAGKLMYPRCLLFCKNYVQDRVYLPPGHRASNRRSCALISGRISPGSFSLAQMSSIPPFGSGDEFIGWQALLLANSFLICLFRVPLLINLCRAGHSSATEAPPTQSHSVSCNCSRRIVAMCLSRLLQSWVPNHLGLGGFPGGSTVKNPPAMQIWVQSLGREDLLEEMATHSSILAWEIPWTEETCGLQSMGSQSQTATKQ